MSAPVTELVERLRAEARALQSQAWSRQDGGQDHTISAGLALEAADALEALTASAATARREGLEEAIHKRFPRADAQTVIALADDICQLARRE